MAMIMAGVRVIVLWGARCRLVVAVAAMIVFIGHANSLVPNRNARNGVHPLRAG